MRRAAGGSSRAAALACALALVGCGGRAVGMPASDSVPAPTFVTTPPDLADSPQLAAVPVRDTAGLDPDTESASAGLLPAALDAAARLDPQPREFVRVSIYDRNVFLEWRDPAVPGRQVSAGYYDDGDLSVSEPRFGEDEAFSVDVIDPTVPVRLVEAIERRFPAVRVTSVDLRVGLSYGFGLVWYVELIDARGTLAVVFADLDGSIVAVDPR